MEKKQFSGFKAADAPASGLALIFDISNFSAFFNKPDLHLYITKYINHVMECVEICLYGGEPYWDNKTKKYNAFPIKPSMRKFLGDGVLYVWENNEANSLNDQNFKKYLLNRLWNVQKFFHTINKKLFEVVPTADLPKAIKFGIAQGTIYKLIEEDNSIDYIGPCINLASRLVKYCPEINFICSARIDLGKEVLEKDSYFKIIATELRSFEKEIVIIDKNDFSRVAPEDKERLFEEIE